MNELKLINSENEDLLVGFIVVVVVVVVIVVVVFVIVGVLPQDPRSCRTLFLFLHIVL